MNYSINTVQEVRDLIWKIENTQEESEENEKLLQKCIQKAQLFKDKNLEFNARLAYLSQVNWLHKKDKAIATFPWLLKEIDKGKKGFYDQHTVLWMYKWVILSLPGFADIPLQRIERLFDDMEKRFLDFGSGIRVINYFKASMYAHTGQLDKARNYIQDYLNDSNEGTLDDCDACQQNNLIDVWLLLGNYEKAFISFKPLAEKELSCKEVPAISFPKMALTNLISGNKAEAKSLAYRARRTLKLDRPYLDHMGNLIMYYALEKEFVKARTVLEKQWHFCFRKQPELNLLWFYLGCLLLFKAMHAAGKKKFTLKTVEKIPLPEDFYQENQILITPVLIWMERQVDGLISRLDQRNGNAFFTRRKEYCLSLASDRC